jgi:hypothetical protein
MTGNTEETLLSASSNHKEPCLLPRRRYWRGFCHGLLFRFPGGDLCRDCDWRVLQWPMTMMGRTTYTTWSSLQKASRLPDLPSETKRKSLKTKALLPSRFQQERQGTTEEERRLSVRDLRDRSSSSWIKWHHQNWSLTKNDVVNKYNYGSEDVFEWRTPKKW